MSPELLIPPASTTPRRQRIVDYPDGDGKPMAETDPHVLQIAALLLTLRFWFRAVENVYVGANMFLYYREGQPKRRVAPDIFVVWGVSKEPRRSYKLWEEKQAPQLIIEITSRKTQEEDLGKKRLIYARIGVAEYYLFDPFGQYLNPPLRGYQLVGEEYMLRTIEALAPPSFNAREVVAGWRLPSERLKLDLWAIPTHEPKKPYVLRFYDPAAGKWLTDPEQALVERELFEKQATDAVAELARLKAELEKLRSKNKTNS